MPKKRTAAISRKTSETAIEIVLNLDGKGDYNIKTGIKFLDHMLSLFAKHGLFDLRIKAKGDLGVDIHHTNEDVGIALGETFAKALGNKKGIRRFGSSYVPMDEALSRVVVDLSGRPAFNFGDKRATAGGILKGEKGYTVKDARQFLQAFVNSVKMNLNVTVLDGDDSHHVLESIFKALGRALDEATILDPRVKGVPSTKGKL